MGPTSTRVSASRVPASRVSAWVVLAVVATGCLTTGCDDRDEHEPSGPRAAPRAAGRVLERQRADVRATLGDLVRLAARGLSGEVRAARGRWDGCESIFPQGYRSFRYDADGRVDAGREATRPYLETLRPVLERHGFVVGGPGAGPGGGRSVAVTRDGLTATVSELPGRGDYVLLSVAGACVEVPADRRAAWSRRRERRPSLRAATGPARARGASAPQRVLPEMGRLPS